MENQWPSTTQPVPIAPGVLIANRYRLQHPLGNGGFGTVYLAEDLKFKTPRRVAIKFLHPQLLTDPQVREDLEREASTLAQLDHPNILTIIDYEVGPSLAYIITRFAEGGSLADLLKPGPDGKPVQLPFEQVAFYLEHLSDALDYAHSEGLIQRDLKPQNVLLDGRGQPLLADFGLATSLATSQSSELVKVNVIGTPEYMAPEQFNGQAGKASDIYALAIMTYEMLAGKPPFTGDEKELEYQQTNVRPPHLSERASNLQYPPILDTIFAKALEKDPAHRFSSATEFYQFFSSAIEGQPKFGETSHPFKFAPISKPLTANLKESEKAAPKPEITVKYLKTLSGYNSEVSNLEWSQNGQVLASVSLGGRVLLWTDQGEFIEALSKNTTNSNSMAWSPNSKMLATAGDDSRIMLWTDKGQPITAFSASSSSISQIGWSRNGNFLTFSYKNGKIFIYEGLNEFTLKSGYSNRKKKVSSFLWSPDSKALAIANQDKTIQIWTLDNPTGSSLVGHTGKITDLAWSPDGKILASASEDTTIKLWSLDGQLVKELTGHKGTVKSLAWSPANQLLTSISDDDTIRFWYSESYPRITLEGGTENITVIAWSPDGKILAAASRDARITFWNPEGRHLLTLANLGGSVNSIAWRPDGKVFASASAYKEIGLWGVTTTP